MNPPRGPARIEGAMLCLSAAIPLLFAAARCSPFASAVHDGAIAQTLGFSWTSPWRALDVPFSSLLLPLPIGTRALRAALTSALLGGFSAGLLFALGRDLLPKEGRATPAFVTAIAIGTTTLSGAWLGEASSAGSSVLGVVLILAPAAWAVHRKGQGWPGLAGLLALASTYEPWVGFVACSAIVPAIFELVAKSRRLSERPPWNNVRAVLASFTLGCVPLAVAFALTRHHSGVAVSLRLFGEASFTPLAPVKLALRELGGVFSSLGLIGAALVLAGRRSRRSAAMIAAMGLSSAVAVAAGAPGGDEQWSAPALTFLGCVALFATVPMHAAVEGIRQRSVVPLAAASAAMIVLLELTFPVLELDSGLARLDARSLSATRLWDDVVFETLPTGALVLVDDRRLYERALAARATCELRPDLAMVPTFDIADDRTRALLAEDPALYPLWRDLLLDGAPHERTLTTLASGRSVVVQIRPSTDRSILRHVVPDGLLGSFHAEPRGSAERLVALQDIAALHEVFPVSSRSLGERSGSGPERSALGTLTAELMDARAKAFLSLGEREAAVRTDADSTSLELPTAIGERRARRLVTSRGSRVAISP